MKLMPSGISCKAYLIYNVNDDCIKSAKSGENVILRLNIIEKEYDRISKGEVMSHRFGKIIPVSESFIAELDIFELPS